MIDAATSATSELSDVRTQTTGAAASTGGWTFSEAARVRSPRQRTSELLSAEAQARLEALIVEFDPLGEMLARARRRRRLERAASGLGGKGAAVGAGDAICAEAGEGDASVGSSVTQQAAGSSPRAKRPARDLRLPQPGSWLRREYRGRDILVRVLNRCFEYEGRRYRSLSAIAPAVTGAHWNGLLFFGLAQQERSQPQPSDVAGSTPSQAATATEIKER